MARTITLGASDVAAHLMLAAGEVTRVVFADGVSTVEVVARDGASDIWYTFGAAPPVANGTRCYVLPAGAIGSDARRPPLAGTTGPLTVSLLAPAATAVTVQRGAL